MLSYENPDRRGFSRDNIRDSVHFSKPPEKSIFRRLMKTGIQYREEDYLRRFSLAIRER